MILLAVWPVTEALGEVLSYVDERGKVHYVDRIERIPLQFQEQARNRPPLPEITRINPSGTVYQGVKTLPPPAKRIRKKVDIYVTSWCPYCLKLEQFLEKHRITYKKHDIERSTKAQVEYQKLGGGGIPVTTIGDDVFRGFNEEKLKLALGIRD